MGQKHIEARIPPTPPPQLVTPQPVLESEADVLRREEAQKSMTSDFLARRAVVVDEPQPVPESLTPTPSLVGSSVSSSPLDKDSLTLTPEDKSADLLISISQDPHLFAEFSRSLLAYTPLPRDLCRLIVNYVSVFEIAVDSCVASSTFGNYNQRNLFGGIGLNSKRKHTTDWTRMWLAKEGAAQDGKCDEKLVFHLKTPAHVTGIGIWAYNFSNDQDRCAKDIEILDANDACVYKLQVEKAVCHKEVDEQRFFGFSISGNKITLHIISNWGQANYMGLSLVTFYGYPLTNEKVENGRG